VNDIYLKREASSEFTCRAAAVGGHLDCLIWAREHDCEWDSDTCEAAAKGGHLECLIWAREHGCDWNSDDCRKEAKKNKHQNILDWMTSIE